MTGKRYRKMEVEEVSCCLLAAEVGAEFVESGTSVYRLLAHAKSFLVGNLFSMRATLLAFG